MGLDPRLKYKSHPLITWRDPFYGNGTEQFLRCEMTELPMDVESFYGKEITREQAWQVV